MRLSAIALLAASTAFSVPASATDLLDDLYDPAPEKYQYTDYNGPYILVGAGYSANWNDVTAAFNGEAIDLATDGFSAIGRLGYDLQFNRNVVGIFGDINWENLDSSSVDNADFSYALGLRAGRVFGHASLAYVNGGVEFTESDINFNSVSSSNFDFKRYFVGVGVESQIGGGFAFGIESQYSWGGDETAPMGVSDGLLDGSDVESSQVSAMFYLKKSWDGF